MTLTAIIPARGGSKRIENKNGEFIGAHSLLSRGIGLARETADRIIVSSDEGGYLAYAIGMRCETHERTNVQDDDHAVEVVLRVIRDMDVTGNVAMMLPTAPFTTATEIIDAERLLDDHPSVIGVHRKLEVNLYHPKPDGGMRRLTDARPEDPDRYSNEVLVVTGGLFLARVNDLVRHRSFHMPGAAPYVQANPLDINDPVDLAKAREMVG